MNLDSATVISNDLAFADTYAMWLHSPGLAGRREPGQFLMLHCSAEQRDPMFARAFSYYRVDGDRFAILYSVVGKGTGWLADRKPGDTIQGYGPLGKGIRFPRDPANLLLVAGGVGVAPMADLAYSALAAGHQVVTMMGARSKDGLLPAESLPREAEYVVVTEDGSAGLTGRVTEHLGDFQPWASRIFACGPNPMFASLADVLRTNGRRQRPQILMEETMPCGWGMCYGCAVRTRHGVKLCCKDGPRFNLFDVF